jgi:predicted DsbA family dithiol-disulfide isomerase
LQFYIRESNATIFEHEAGGFSAMRRRSQPGSKISAICAISVSIILSLMMIASIEANAQAPVKAPPNCVCGNLDAPVRLDVFSDFQCPACRAFFSETVSQLRKLYAPAGKVCVIYHEFPLKQHAYGRKAARYSLAAQQLGKKQWLAVLESLYEKQALWSLDGNIESVLSQTVSSDDLALIKKNLKDPSIEKTLEGDIALGEKKGVQGTPSIFVTVHNREHPKAPYAPYAIWKDYLDSILK